MMSSSNTGKQPYKNHVIITVYPQAGHFFLQKAVISLVVQVLSKEYAYRKKKKEEEEDHDDVIIITTHEKELL